ncbi:Putative glycosyl transferase (partial match) [Frankia alni ACN14a]|uniref:Glycosyl transferase (Partial match) n=2 Tax=Frankia TaxID=1854 RepID=Q0RQS6_FRAAA|nr:Putative glycosyl transferase (partial match) [Frankia alni ACN14a]
MAASLSVTVLQWIALASLLAWLYLAVGHGFFWRTDQRLPARQAPPSWPSVAIIIPARDEADVLPVTLPTLLAQDYPGPVRLILVDDGSTDGTTEVARALAEQAARNGHTGVTAAVTASTEPPPGWTGKLWALRRGVDCAGDAEFLLLTDADIAHDPGSLTSLVASARTHGLDMVSQMAVLRAETVWERVIVPAFVYFFAMLYPFRWSNRPRSRVAAAAGGCSLVRREALLAAGGLAEVRGAVIDDVAIARIIKRSGGRTWLGLAEQVHSRRPYPRLADLWKMVSRSAYAQLRHSPLLLLGTVLGMSLVFVVPVVATIAGLAAGDGTTAILGAVAWVIMTLSYVPMIRYYRQPVPAALLLPGVAVLYLGMTLDSARLKWAGRGAAWKGRTYDDHGTPSAERHSSAATTPATAPSVPAPSESVPSESVPSAVAQPTATVAPSEASPAGAGPVAAAASAGPGVVTIPAAAGPVEPPHDPWNDGFSRPSPRPGRTDAPRREDAARAVPASGRAQSQARADDRQPGAGR